nr:reverse transcriptase domain-containing protein [Tanacetum cinerariifolium]
SAILLAVASHFFWQWKLSSLAVGTSSASGNFVTGSGNALCILFPTEGNAKIFSIGITLYRQWELFFNSSGKLLWQWELITASGNALCILFPTAARIWLEKEPPRSILTWDDLVSKFINQFFPLSKTKNIHNEITRFQQRFDESFYEAWDRFNDLLRACPHHGFSELH